jgi:hypothetical protein
MDLPAGIRLFVSVRNMMPVHATLEAVLVESASSLYPRDARVTIEGNEARETVIANGSTVVVWEMTALGHTPTTIEFLAYIVPFPENGRDRRTRCAVSGSFSPGPPDFAASAAAAASSTLPVPRFMPSAFAPKVFEINF